jgi:hypothetical protein
MRQYAGQQMTTGAQAEVYADHFIMGIAAITALAGAALMLALSALGLIHARRSAPDAEIFPRLTTPAEATTS